MSTADPKPLMGVDEVAAFYGVPTRTLYAWRAQGKGPVGIRLGRYVKFRREDVLRFLEEHTDTALTG